GEQLVGMRPVYAGKIMSKVTWAKSPWVATLRPNVFRPADAQPGKTAQIEKPSVTIPAATLAFVERREETSTGLPELAEAETVISGGRGMKGPENYVILEDLGRVIGAAVGASRAAVVDRDARFPHETIKRMGELGLMGIFVPERWGGAGGDVVAYSLAMEEIARVCGSHAVVMSVNNSLFCDPINKYGTDAQRERFLRPVASGHETGCFALTEPQAGSDATNQHTLALRDS